MKAVIIAAGKGRRINHMTNGKPKPLLEILGLSLIERTILAVKKCGISEFVIVTGYKGKMIKEKLGNGERYGVNIEYVRNKDWNKENGLSVLVAEKKVGRRFLLFMSDHIFDPGIVKDLLKTKKKTCLLCVDRNPKEYIDMNDATKVRIKNDRIVDIGKSLKEYDAVDCGIFLLTGDIFEAIKASMRKGDTSLSGGIKVLARKGKIKIFDIGERFWIDVDTIEDYKHAENLLLKSLIKENDGPVSRYINRKISTRLTKFLVKTRIGPNDISLLSFLLAAVSSLLFIAGNHLYTALAGVVAQISSIVDGCDGEIARLRFENNPQGAFFDASLDRYSDSFIILGMTYAYWMLTGFSLVWIIGFMALLGTLINSYTAGKYKAEFQKVFGYRISKIKIGRDVRIFLIMIGSIVNQILPTLLLIALLTNLENFRRIIVLGLIANGNNKR